MANCGNENEACVASHTQFLNEGRFIKQNQLYESDQRMFMCMFGLVFLPLARGVSREN